MTTAALALPNAALRRRGPLEALLVAAALAVAYLVLHPFSADLAAQVYRTELFQRVGFTLWNGQWFAGHHAPGYSVLFPPLAAAIGPRVVGALAAVASALLFERLARPHFGSRARLGALWFGAASATNLFTGRLTFALGVAIGLGALLAAQRGRARLGAALAVLCPLGSPVAGLFLALAALAWFWADRRRAALALALAALATAAVLVAAFPEGGTEPFAVSAFWPTLAFAAAVLILVPARERWLRHGALLYAAASVVAFSLSTPMGSNVVRLGTLFGGPLLALALWRRRGWALAALALPLLYWQWMPPVRDVAAASGDPAVHAAYYAPLNRFLAAAHPTGRVEIPPTRNHWETAYVSPHFALARGWERQLDIKYNPLFYAPRLAPQRYRAWLRANGVQYVALPDARLDYAAHTEAALVRAGLPYLRPVWRGGHWQVFRVRGAAPLVSAGAAGAHLVALDPNGFTLDVRRAGSLDVRVRYTRYWSLERGAGCVLPAPGGFTRVLATRPERLRVVAELEPGRLLSGAPACRGTPG
jgi:hypothetical protein